ncbi:5'-nucleotidase [candidate division WOR_3 bacterium SM23_60]|uniref:5'-nucleotidase n=1 Tax=candidate division WOR_3 bacterium SM23_60 TaxID=1703780 RepID=A0A0S8GLD9_UNCW3|nr:MAG: 5'-nucleotidase [candidate division WOR_3 bacterium SM23_60]
MTRHYNFFIFDLDGTLTDPKVGITNSIRYALERLDIKEGDESRLVKFIGPPLLESFCRYYGLSDSRARQAIDYYREYFTNKGIFENQVYDGIRDLLSRLHKHKCQLVIATSKPTIYAKRILKHFRLHGYFDLVVGSNMDLTRSSKSEVITEVLKFMPDSKGKAILIGDRADDVIVAKAYMIDSVAVGYGYGSESELIAAKPTYTIRTVGELTRLLLGFAEI